MSELLWKKYQDYKPAITNKYFVRRKQHDIPTVAVYNANDDIWFLLTNGMYWQIIGVYDWAEIERRKKK